MLHEVTRLRDVCMYRFDKKDVAMKELDERIPKPREPTMYTSMNNFEDQYGFHKYEKDYGSMHGMCRFVPRGGHVKGHLWKKHGKNELTTIGEH